MSVSFKLGFKGGPKQVFKNAACFAGVTRRLDDMRAKKPVKKGAELYFSLLLKKDEKWMLKSEKDRVFLCQLWLKTFGALLKPDEVKSIRILKNGEISYITYNCANITWWKLVTISSFFRMATENCGWVATCNALNKFDIHPWVLHWMAMNLNLTSRLPNWTRDPYREAAELSDNTGHSPIESDKLVNLSNLRKFVDGSIANRWDRRPSTTREFWAGDKEGIERHGILSCYGRDKFLLSQGHSNWIAVEGRRHKIEVGKDSMYTRPKVNIPDFISEVINKHPELAPVSTQEKV